MEEATLAQLDPGASLEFPADAAYVATARIFASAIARHYDAADDAVEDVKLAISEACGVVIRGARSDASVRVETRWSGDQVAFEVSSTAELRTQDPADTPTPAALGMELVTALFEDAVMLADADGTAIRFSVPVGPPE